MCALFVLLILPRHGVHYNTPVPCSASSLNSSSRRVSNLWNSVSYDTIHFEQRVQIWLRLCEFGVAEAPPEILIQEHYVCILYSVRSKGTIVMLWTLTCTAGKRISELNRNHLECIFIRKRCVAVHVRISIDRKLVEQSFRLSRVKKKTSRRFEL